MIFRWHPNNAWNPREWITKRLNMRQKGGYWDNDELYDKVRRIADPHIQKKRVGNTKAKDLQDEITYLFDETVRSEKESHILAWMMLLYMHSELDKNSKWSLAPLYTPTKMSSVFNTIYHLCNDLGSVFVMKAFAQRGHSPRLYMCEEGTLHYPAHAHTLWADVGNAMYAYMNDHLNLASDGPGLGAEQAGDVIEIAYNLYAMYALFNIDVESLLGIDQTVLAGWWAQINMIQRDAYIQSAAMLSGSKCSTCRLEQVCIYISGLTQLMATEAVSVVKGKESHVGSCPVPYCYVCGAVVGQKRETTSLYAASQSYWSHTDRCMKSRLCGYVKEKPYYPVKVPGNYDANMDHIDLIEAQLTKEGMLAYDSIEEASIAALQEMILYQRRNYFDALNDRYTPVDIGREPIKVNFCYSLMHMIATGQLFEPYLYHPDANHCSQCGRKKTRK